MNTKTTTELHLANITYQEACNVTEAYRIQLSIRKRNAWTASDQAEAALRIEEAEYQLAAAERHEFASWQQLEHLRAVWVNGG